MTYRLLFGQDKRSWKLRRKNIGQKGETKPSDGFDDPLLRRLCCYDWTTETLYDELDAPNVRSLYSAHQDYPFFGDRLIALQEYSRLFQPYYWKTLCFDWRDMNQFCGI
jgi:hypothetical protein